MKDHTTFGDNAPPDMPFFKLFVKDEMANVALLGLTAENYGVFCLIRNQIWAKGFVNSDCKKLAKILQISLKKFEKIWETISPLFLENDGKLTIPDLDEQRSKYLTYLENQREAGRKSAAKRANGGSTDDQPPFNPRSTNTEYIIQSTNSNSQNAETQNSEHTHQTTNARASQSAKSGVCSIHSFEIIEKYIEACRNSGQEIGDGLIVYLRAGKGDQAISDFLETGKIFAARPQRESLAEKNDAAMQAALAQFEREDAEKALKAATENNILSFQPKAA